MTFTVEQIASLLADAHLNGWRDGHMLCPEPDTDNLFLGYHDAVADMVSEHVEH